VLCTTKTSEKEHGAAEEMPSEILMSYLMNPKKHVIPLALQIERRTSCNYATPKRTPLENEIALRAYHETQMGWYGKMANPAHRQDVPR
jgi:hypothetical protein